MLILLQVEECECETETEIETVAADDPCSVSTTCDRDPIARCDRSPWGYTCVCPWLGKHETFWNETSEACEFVGGCKYALCPNYMRIHNAKKPLSTR